MFLNINSSNGYSSCIKCQQPGENVEFGNGHHIVFKYDDEKIDQPLRTRENYLIDLETNKNG